ncbi:phenylacetate--CoA ligase family protein, partial [Ruminiclostridium josui]
NSVLRKREKQIKKIVIYAYYHSEFYRNLYNLHKIDINNFKIQDLPIVTKNDILTYYDKVLTNNEISYEEVCNFVNNGETSLLKGKYGVFSSGGSSGVRCHIPYDEKGLYTVNALTVLRSGLVKLGLRQRIAFLGGVNHTNNTGSLKKNGIFKNQVQIETLPLFISEDEVIERLNQFQPSTIAAYSYMIRNLAVQKISGKLRANPSRLRCGGTPFSQNDKQIVKEAFGTLPYENYGASESLLIASDCKIHEGMHINEDCYFVEFLDTKDKSLGDLRLSEGILVTNLYNKIFPLIRYKFDDRIVYSEGKCKCGSSFRKIVTVKGRENDFFVFYSSDKKEHQIHPIEFSNRILKIPSVKEYRLIQDKPDGLVIHISAKEVNECGELSNTITDIISTYLLATIGRKVPIEIKYFNELKKDSVSGKLVPFITMSKWRFFQDKIEQTFSQRHIQ